MMVRVLSHPELQDRKNPSFCKFNELVSYIFHIYVSLTDVLSKNYICISIYEIKEELFYLIIWFGKPCKENNNGN